MSDTQNTPLAIEESAIKTAADTMIRAAAHKSGMTFEEVPEQAKQDAYNHVKASMEAEQAEKSNPMYIQLQAERTARRQAEATLAAVTQSRTNLNTSAVRTGPDPNVVRAQLGEDQWHMLTDNGRLQACDINPATVTPLDLSEAKKAFGRGPDTHFASNLSKQDWGRYKYLKNLSIIKNLQGQ
jgi:hypothetical protein